MKTVISVIIVFFATIDWTAKGSSNLNSIELEFQQAAANYKNAVTDLASEIAIGRSKDHYIAAQQKQMKNLGDSILIYETKKK